MVIELVDTIMIGEVSDKGNLDGNDEDNDGHYVPDNGCCLIWP